jgi:hypothetical protein
VLSHVAEKVISIILVLRSGGTDRGILAVPKTRSLKVHGLVSLSYKEDLEVVKGKAISTLTSKFLNSASLDL